jgi:hypothetical protein
VPFFRPAPASLRRLGRRRRIERIDMGGSSFEVTDGGDADREHQQHHPVDGRHASLRPKTQAELRTAEHRRSQPPAIRSRLKILTTVPGKISREPAGYPAKRRAIATVSSTGRIIRVAAPPGE